MKTLNVGNKVIAKRDYNKVDATNGGVERGFVYTVEGIMTNYYEHQGVWVTSLIIRGLPCSYGWSIELFEFPERQPKQKQQ